MSREEVSAARPASARIDAPAEVTRIVERLESAGFATWAVGGAVRDALRGGRPSEWDLATAAHPRDVQRLFRRTVPVGIEHGTVGIVGGDGRMYETTTFRRDVETDGRRARVSFSDTIDEDLSRRDFTINALAWHPVQRVVLDPFDGEADLEAGVLRTVGDPRERFREDRLRVLRGFRFAGRFGLEIDDTTWRAACEAVPALRELSAERVREELLKVLREIGEPLGALRLYERAGVLEVLFPELAALAADKGGASRWEHVLAVVDGIPRHRPLLRLAALFHDVATEPVGDEERRGASAAVARAILRRLKASNADTDRVVHLVARYGTLPPGSAPAVDVRRWLRTLGRPFVRDALRLEAAEARARGAPLPGAAAAQRRALALLRGGDPLSVSELAVDGRDLRALGLRPGPRYGEILDDLLARALENPEINRRERLLELVREREA